jgi:hypothetical protein
MIKPIKFDLKLRDGTTTLRTLDDLEENLTPEQLKEITVKIGLSMEQKIGKFIVQDGIATDTETGLTWLRFAYGQNWKNDTVTGDAEKRRWNMAMKIPAEFNQTGYAGYKDWRIPNIEELKTLIDKERGTEENYIDASVFPENAKWFWSSSRFAGYSGKVWSINFNFGGANSCNMKANSSFVRLVRG